MPVRKMETTNETTNFAKCAVIVGNKGTGKTTYLIKAINSYMQDSSEANPKRVLIIDTYLSEPYADYQEIKPSQLIVWKKGVKRLVVQPFELESIIDILIDYDVNNFLLIVEDCGKYVENDKQLSKSLKIWQRDIKNKGRQTIFVFHYFADVPRAFFKLTDVIIIKKTADTITDVKGRTSNPSIIQAYKEVTENANKFYTKIVNIT